MTLKTGIDLAESSEFFDVEIPRSRERRIEYGGNMTVRKEEKVFILPIHMKTGIVFEHFEIECRKEIRTSKGTARVAALRAIDHANDIPANLCSNCF